ncbi:MAG: phosphatase PAP2 family protein [Candidatus Dormibacteria bacterium]
MDVSGSLHSLTGHSGLIDQLVALTAKYGIALGVVAALMLWVQPAGVRALIALAGGALLALLAGSLISHLWFETRPFATGHYQPLISHDSDASFPSDHLCVLGALVGATWPNWRRLGWASLALAVAVGLARVVAGVHYAGDVLAGFLLGLVGAVAVWHALTPAGGLIARLDAGLTAMRLRPARPALVQGDRPAR